MTLRCKTQLFLGVILLSVLLILDILFTNFLITSAEQTDRERMTRDLSRTSVTLNGEVRTLSAIAGNWAYSDKAWDYMTGLNPDYPNIYLNRAVLTEIGVSSLIFIDNDFNVKFARDYSAPTTAPRLRARSARSSATRERKCLKIFRMTAPAVS